MPILAKLLEITVYYQRIHFLNRFNILDPRQHAFRPNHSTKTAIIQPLYNRLISADNKRPTQAIFLDLSSAFDNIDHDILITRLDKIGITRTVLKRISNFIRDLYFSVKIYENLSSPRKLCYGIPQCSILSPIIIAIYLLPFPNVHYILYADDSEYTR